jgi:serine/threonine protein kinase
MDLLKRMLTFNPRNRITVAQAMNHPFFEPLKRHQYFQDYIHRAQNSFLDGSGDIAIEEIDDSSREIAMRNVSLFFVFNMQSIKKLMINRLIVLACRRIASLSLR